MNIASEEVTTYRVFINGSNSWNETNNDIDDNVTLTAYPVCSCVSTNIVSVAAVNRCGRVGPSTPEIMGCRMYQNYIFLRIYISYCIFIYLTMYL